MQPFSFKPKIENALQISLGLFSAHTCLTLTFEELLTTQITGRMEQASHRVLLHTALDHQFTERVGSALLVTTIGLMVATLVNGV